MPIVCSKPGIRPLEWQLNRSIWFRAAPQYIQRYCGNTCMRHVYAFLSGKCKTLQDIQDLGNIGAALCCDSAMLHFHGRGYQRWIALYFDMVLPKVLTVRSPMCQESSCLKILSEDSSEDMWWYDMNWYDIFNLNMYFDLIWRCLMMSQVEGPRPTGVLRWRQLLAQPSGFKARLGLHW